jgi:hypothetical protein
MKKFLLWLAHSPVAEAGKIGLGAGCAWLLNNITSLNLAAEYQAIVVAVITIIIDALNPHDNRFGKKKTNVPN